MRPRTESVTVPPSGEAVVVVFELEPSEVVSRPGVRITAMTSDGGSPGALASAIWSPDRSWLTSIRVDGPTARLCHNVSPGRYALIVYAPGYAPEVRTVHVLPTEKTEVLGRSAVERGRTRPARETFARIEKRRR